MHIYPAADSKTPTLVLAHGAGAGEQHPWMVRVAKGLAARDIHVVTFNFPYMDAGRKAPDPGAVLEKAYGEAWGTLVSGRSGPLFAGGKSMGGRMTSRAAAADPLPGVRGIAFFGFPLHPGGKPGTERADHLARVGVPLLFLQGTRDRLADLALLVPIVERLGPRATLHAIEDADHSFHVPARTGRTDAEVLDELARRTAAWAAAC